MTQPRPTHLAVARRRDIDAKRTRVHESLRRLHGSGQRLTVARIARDAQVSTWFVYNTSELITAIRDAMQDQIDNGPRPNHDTPAPVTGRSVATDLSLAREEIRDLRLQRDKLRVRLQLSLGADLDTTTREEFVARIDVLESENATVRAELATARRALAAHEKNIAQLTEDLDGARLSLRRMMRQPLQPPPDPESQS